MTDSGDSKVAIDGPLKRPQYHSDASLDLDIIAIELRRNSNDRDLQTFRTLINIKNRLDDANNSSKWRLVIVELLRIITSSDDVGEEQVLLASLAFVNVSFRSSDCEDFTKQLRSYWGLKISLLEVFDEIFQIHDLEWFKLVLTHGYLQVNIESIYSRDIISLAFESLERNCLIYTKYSYFAYKTLYTWLDKTEKTNFWLHDDSKSMENNLEAIIFSNWDNCICENARRNSSQIFSVYLRIMSKNYEGFLNYIYENCLQNLSWQNVLKYTILAEVCLLWDDLPKIVSSDLPSCLFTSLTNNNLKHSGTKLYLTILNKLKANDWQRIFSDSFFRISAIWESGEQTNAIELLWEQWMKPTIAKFSDIFEFLWKNPLMRELKLSRSYLERIGDRLGFKLPYDDSEFREILSSRVIDISELVRLNAFAILCQMKNWTIKDVNSFAAVKIFLYFNINTSSVSMRKGILKNFNIFYENIVDFSSQSKEAKILVAHFFRWFHVFLLNCFEMGSSYQRKILALNLYEIVLIMVNDGNSCVRLCNVLKTNKNNKLNKLKKCAAEFAQFMNLETTDGSVYEISEDRWLYCDEKSRRIMYILVQDQIPEIRDKATLMLLDYFSANIFSETEDNDNRSLRDKSLLYSSSPKSHNVGIAVAFARISTLWYSIFRPAPIDIHRLIIQEHYNNVRDSLSKMQRSSENICLTNVAPVHGSLTVILEVGTLIDSWYGDADSKISRHTLDVHEIEKILELAEDVTRFFLSALSAKAKSDKYSSSFEEMAQAIGDYVKSNEIDENTEECILSPTHQLLLSCIWMSLKVSSEMSAEIGSIAKTEELARRAVDLIVSVLLKCRHKGAIEAAGLALAKLTKNLSKGKYSGLIESRLLNLLNIDESDNINLTRRGAGLSIMFHKIVSSDDRRNRPWLHMTVKKLLDFLKTETEDSSIQNDHCIVDSPRARHLHFLRSLVADKNLQAQLVPYIEEICIICLKYLQSCQWTVRNASLQLFGAVVSRLVGQCSARELDYGVGNSVEHFTTHFPNLAETIMRQLKYSVKEFIGGNRESCKIVPILTLLSKMSCGGCDLIDNTSKNYLSEARDCFVKFFEHPVLNVRSLAGKAYAAFVPLPDILFFLTELQFKSLLVKPKKQYNYEHGLYCAQLYLVRKSKYELRSTSDTFFIEKHKNYEDITRRASHLQLQLLASRINRWLSEEERICYTVESAVIKYLLESQISFSSNGFPLNWTQAHIAIGNKTEESSKPGFSEFLDDFMLLSAHLDIAHDTSKLSLIFSKDLHCLAHRSATMKNLHAKRCNLRIFVSEAFAIIEDNSKSCVLLSIVDSISEAISSDCTDIEEISPEMKLEILELANRLKKINDKSSYSRRLRKIGVCIALKMTSFDASLLDSTMDYIFEEINDGDSTLKESLIDCLSLIINVSRVDIVEFLLKTRSKGGILFVKAIVEFLTDEDSDVRESMAKVLQPITGKCIGDQNSEAVCAKAALHMILKKLSLAWNESCSNTKRYILSIFKSLSELSTIFMAIDDSKKQSYEIDDLLNRDESSFINILLHYETMLVDRTLSTCMNANIQVQDIDGSIEPDKVVEQVFIGDISTKRQNPLSLVECLKISAMDYMLSKRGFLRK